MRNGHQLTGFSNKSRSNYKRDKHYNRISNTACVIVLAAYLILPSLCLSEVSLPGVFGDHMVLQRGMKSPVWGTADPGEKVTVSIDGKSSRTTTGKDGHWMVKLKKMKAGGPYQLIVSGKNTVTFRDVMVGEVWVCSGQSNMWWTVERLKNADDHISPADFPEIRLLEVSRISKNEPQYDFQGKKPEWVRCSPEAVVKFSAVALFFGRKLHNELDVPIGLLHSSWGGSVAEAWTSHETLNADSQLRPLIEDLDSLKSVPDERKKHIQSLWAEYWKAYSKKTSLPEMPPHIRWSGSRDYPSGLYNAMLTPMIPYGIKGAIWYQGESNVGRSHQYRTLFPAMIKDWRKLWKQGKFPFLFVQLANYNDVWGNWPELREAQTMTLKLPNTAMAVTVDIGNPDNIHPNNKWDVGERLALGALHTAYGRDNVYSGPMYKSMKREGRTIRLKFNHIADGLSVKGSRLTGFIIAGKNRKFHDAQAVIDGNEVVVSGSGVTSPVAVRYGWEDSPKCNLFNTAGLPASPFRTDDWPCETLGNLKP